MTTTSGRRRPASEDPDLWRALGMLLDPFALFTAVRDSSGQVVDLECADANEAACTYLRRDYGDLVGRRVLETIPGQLEAGLFQAYADVVETGNPLALDDVVYAPKSLGGAPRRYDIRALRFRDGIALTWRDVTERHEREAALAASEMRFRLLAENASDVVFLAGPDGRLQWVAPSVTRSLGWSPDVLVGTELGDLVHPDDLAPLQRFRAPLSAGVRVPELADGEVLVRMRAKDGSHRWVAGRAVPVSRPDGSLLGVAGGFHDVDDLVHAKDEAEEARRSERRTMLTMDSAVIGMAVVEPDGRFRYVNPALCRMLGYSRERLQQLTFVDVTHPDDLVAGLRGLARIVSGERDSFTQRKRYRTAAGAIIWCDLYTAAVRDEEGRLLHQVAQMVDVTGEVLAREAAARRPG